MGAVALLLLIAAAPAWAHAPQADGAHDVLRHFSFEPWVIAPLLLALVLYAIGVARLWQHAGTGRGITRTQVWCFAGGWLSLVVALVSPLDALGRYAIEANKPALKGKRSAHLLDPRIDKLAGVPAEQMRHRGAGPDHRQVPRSGRFQMRVPSDPRFRL